MVNITLPHKFVPRDYQLPLLEALDSGIKRAVIVWHRRSGKDKECVNIFPKKMLERKGAYYYFFPTYAQGKKIIWEGMDRDGFKFLDHFPKELMVGKQNNTDMKIKFKNGSLFQVIGTDNINSVVGTNPVGCVFSEYALQNPRAWDFIRPILAENDGWVVFNFTPRGENFAYDLYIMAQNNVKYFCQKLTVDDTNVITRETIQEERDSGMSEDMVQQEYFCSFQAAILGSYYSEQIRIARKEKRFTRVPYDSRLPVHTVWDLGVSKDDAMSIGFFQNVGTSVNMIDYYENTNFGFPHYAKVLKDKPYVYGKHFAPFDIGNKEMGTGKTRLHAAKKLGLNFKVVPSISIEDGIDNVRACFNRFWFDAENCKIWIRAIPNYTKKWDETKRVFSNSPDHNWASHPADMFRYACIVIDEMVNEKEVIAPTPEIEQVEDEYMGDQDPIGDRKKIISQEDLAKM